MVVVVLQTWGRSHHGRAQGRCVAEGVAERACCGLTAAPCSIPPEPFGAEEQSKVKG